MEFPSALTVPAGKAKNCGSPIPLKNFFVQSDTGKRKLFLIIHELSFPAQTAVNGPLMQVRESFGRRRSRSPMRSVPR